MGMNLKEFATAVVLTGTVLLNQQEATAQDLNENLNDTEWNHRTPESQKQWNKLFYKGQPITLPKGLSYEEYVDCLKNNEKKILKFYKYADKTLTNLSEEIKTKLSHADSVLENMINTSTYADTLSTRNTIETMDSIFFDEGNPKIVESYMKKTQSNNPKSSEQIYEQLTTDLKKKNNVNLIADKGEIYFIPSVSLRINHSDKNTHIDITQSNEWPYIGKGIITPRLNTSSYTNRSPKNLIIIKRLAEDFERLFGEEIEDIEFRLGVTLQEAGHKYFPEMNEQDSDRLSSYAYAGFGKLMFLLRLSDFHNTHQNNLTIQDGMGSEYYWDIYYFFYSKDKEFPGFLEGITNAKDRTSWSKENKDILKQMLDIYMKEAKDFVEGM